MSKVEISKVDIPRIEIPKVGSEFREEYDSLWMMTETISSKNLKETAKNLLGLDRMIMIMTYSRDDIDVLNLYYCVHHEENVSHIISMKVQFFDNGKYLYVKKRKSAFYCSEEDIQDVITRPAGSVKYYPGIFMIIYQVFCGDMECLVHRPGMSPTGSLSDIEVIAQE